MSPIVSQLPLLHLLLLELELRSTVLVVEPTLVQVVPVNLSSLPDTVPIECLGGCVKTGSWVAFLCFYDSLLGSHQVLLHNVELLVSVNLNGLLSGLLSSSTLSD